MTTPVELRMGGVARTRLGFVLFVALVLQLTFSTRTGIDGVHPDLMLLVTVAAGLVGGENRGAVIGFLAGLSADLFLQQPFGLSALCLTLVGYGVGRLRQAVLAPSAWLTVAVGLLASAAGVLLLALLGAIVGESQMLTDRLGPIVAVVAAFNAGGILLAVPSVRWAMENRPGPARSSRW